MEEENKILKWIKEKKKVIIYVVASIIAIAVIVILIFIFAMKDNRKKQEETTTKKATEETTMEQTTEPTSETAPEPTQSPVTVNPTSGAVNVFSTSAGAEQDEFFKNSVFAGDSVMYGFQRYVEKRGEGFLGNPMFLTAGSYAARIELDAITEKSPHPLYKGSKVYIRDALPQIGADKVFLFFGLNDIGLLGVDKTVENYGTVISKIKEQSPDIKIYIISTTYMAAGSELKSLNNANIKLLNEGLKANAEAWDVEFIDIANYMYDANGCLAQSFSSDNYVHLTDSAYDLWVAVLRDYALKH